jgi:hypothetical protein
MLDFVGKKRGLGGAMGVAGVASRPHFICPPRNVKALLVW